MAEATEIGSPCLVSQKTLAEMNRVNEERFLAVCATSMHLEEPPEHYIEAIAPLVKASITKQQVVRFVQTALLLEGFTYVASRSETIFTLLSMCAKSTAPKAITKTLYCKFSKFNQTMDFARLTTRFLKDSDVRHRSLAHHLQMISLPSIPIDGLNGLTHLLIQLAYNYPPICTTIHLPSNISNVVAAFSHYSEFKEIIKVYTMYLRSVLSCKVVHALSNRPAGSKLTIIFVPLQDIMNSRKMVPGHEACTVWEVLWINVFCPLYQSRPEIYEWAPISALLLKKWQKLNANATTP